MSNISVTNRLDKIIRLLEANYKELRTIAYLLKDNSAYKDEYEEQEHE
jgi:hypothetical protein